MTISMDKQYRTRDGREVRIYAVDGMNHNKVHGAVKLENGWGITTWRDDGVAWDTKYDLIEAKPRIQREYWVNVYSDLESLPSLVITKKDADNFRSSGRIACVKITIDCEEGEGL
jgi:hypothetical protein